VIIRKWLIFLTVHDEPRKLAAAQNKVIVADLSVDYCSNGVAVSCDGRIQVDSVISCYETFFDAVENR
jgi:hypothetical protein